MRVFLIHVFNYLSLIIIWTVVHCLTSQIEFLAKECLPALGLFLVEELTVAVQNAVNKEQFPWQSVPDSVLLLFPFKAKSNELAYNILGDFN